MSNEEDLDIELYLENLKGVDTLVPAPAKPVSPKKSPVKPVSPKKSPVKPVSPRTPPSLPKLSPVTPVSPRPKPVSPKKSPVKPVSPPKPSVIKVDRTKPVAPVKVGPSKVTPSSGKKPAVKPKPKVDEYIFKFSASASKLIFEEDNINAVNKDIVEYKLNTSDLSDEVLYGIYHAMDFAWLQQEGDDIEDDEEIELSVANYFQIFHHHNNEYDEINIVEEIARSPFSIDEAGFNKKKVWPAGTNFVKLFDFEDVDQFQLFKVNEYLDFIQGVDVFLEWTIVGDEIAPFRGFNVEAMDNKKNMLEFD